MHRARAGALAFETIRAHLRGRRLHRARLPRRRPTRAELDGRERAQAQRLAYGAVQRRGTHRRRDRAAAPAARRGCSTRRCWPALRLGLYELLFADGTPDHAAVDQAVELVKRAGAAHAAGLRQRGAAPGGREREALIEALLGDDSTPEGAAVAHSAPLWLAQMWWEELGPEDARSLLAACNEPAGGRLPRQHPAHRRRAVLAACATPA